MKRRKFLEISTKGSMALGTAPLILQVRDGKAPMTG